MGEQHELVAFEPPDFNGHYEILFTSDQVAMVQLVGATRDSYGHPIYLYDDTGTVYNFGTVISLKKVEKPHG